MTWPQPAQSPPGAKSGPPLGALLTAGAGVLTFLLSFISIAEIGDGLFGDDGRWSVWNTDQFGTFGVGTYIPLLALVAAGAALARAFAKGMADKEIAGVSLLHLQLLAGLVPFLLVLGYVVNVLVTEFEWRIGLPLLFITTAALAGGTIMSLLEAKKARDGSSSSSSGTTSLAAPSGPPPGGSWPSPTGAVAEPAQWQQPGPPPAPGQWQPPPPPPPGQWQQAGPPPGQWAAPGPPFPTASEPQPWTPEPAPPSGPEPGPGPLDPQPAPPLDPQPEPSSGGGMFDPGTQVIPGPPPAPPADPLAAPPPPPVPPPNTP